MTTEITNETLATFAGYLMATALILVDVAAVLVIGFEFVMPVVSAVPDVGTMQILRAVGILALLAFMQVLFVPGIAVQFTPIRPASRETTDS